MTLPPSIDALTGGLDCTPNTVGMSGSQVICFDNMVLKIEPTCENSENEQLMMKWLAGRLPVPEILAFERLDGMNYLLMSRMPGQMLCSHELLCAPDRLTELIAEGLEMLWSVDISDCPPLCTLDSKLRLAGERVAQGVCSVEDAEPTTYGPGGFRSPEHLLVWLTDNRPEEQPVLSHGDFCLPNVFELNGKISGLIDLGRCGVSDRWQDIALGLRSLENNLNGTYGTPVYPPVDPQRLFDRLGISVNSELMRYYLLLDELF